jgi:uncharacterized protein (DUF58 family)
MSAKGTGTCGVLLFVVGLVAKSRAIAFGGAYIFIAACLATAYAKGSLGRIHYRREFSSLKASVGDKVTLRIAVENRKPLPVLWLNCEDEVPDARTLGMLPTYSHNKPRRAILKNVTYLKWFERVEREFTMECLTRGVLGFGPVRLSSGDLMGFKEALVQVPASDTLTVYPRMASVQGISWDEHFPLGDSPSRGWIHPDPLTIAGARPYTAGTPLKQVAWRSTARTGILQERLLEPTVQRNIVVALSLSTGDHYWEGVNSELMETAVFLCASLCRELLHRGTQFGLAANSAGVRAGRRALVMQPGSSRDHMLKILGVLARLTMPWMEFHTTLRFLAKEAAPDMGILALMPHQLKEDWDEVMALVSAGRSVAAVLLAADDGFTSYYRKVPSYVPSAPVDWRRSEVISFVRIA